MNVQLDAPKLGNDELQSALGDQRQRSDYRTSDICFECDAPVPPGEWWCATCYAAYKREMGRQ